MAKAKKSVSDPHPATPLPAVGSPEVPAPSEAPAAPLPRWRVSIPWVPSMEVEAQNQDEAIETYKGLMSILSTTHQFTVEKLG